MLPPMSLALPLFLISRQIHLCDNLLLLILVYSAINLPFNQYPRFSFFRAVPLASRFAYAGKRLRAPLVVTRPGCIVAGFRIAMWLLTICNVFVATFVYRLQMKQAYRGFVAVRVRVDTFVDALVTFLVILYLTRRWGWKVALASAIIGTAAAPMIFEFPFDLIVMTRTNPPIPTHRCCIACFSSCRYTWSSSQRYRY